MPTKKQIQDILNDIPDPEIGISIYELGLIYDVAIDKKQKIVTITMTLTSVGCPLFDVIASPIRERIQKLPQVKKVDIVLTFEPPWSVEKMSESAKLQLGLI